MQAALPRLVPGLSALSADFPLVLCDVWGVVHGGVRAFPDAADALARHRAAGGHVMLVSNAPRPAPSVERQLLDVMGLPRHAYDSVLTSGDVSRQLIAARPGVPLHHVGPERDLPLFADLDAPRVPLDEADYVVCTGLFDDTKETPADYADLFRRMRERGLFMLCANPDLVVERAGELVYCAGALGVAYREAGGEVALVGKPHETIYDAAFTRVAAQGLTRVQALMIGDAIRTDVAGANGAGIASLFVAHGIHTAEIASVPEGEDRLVRWLAQQASIPTYAIDRLRW